MYRIEESKGDKGTKGKLEGLGESFPVSPVDA